VPDRHEMAGDALSDNARPDGPEVHELVSFRCE